jgi:hypothetical protein
MVTAEPDFAVVDPSPQVVLYGIDENARKESAEKKAPPKKANLWFYTHYTAYDLAPSAAEAVPNELLQARKAVELASRSGVRAVAEPKHAEANLTRAKSFLNQAETAYKKHPNANIVQSARTAAQIAENARALALGAVGGNLIRQLEDELARVRAELEETRAELSKTNAGSLGDPTTSSPKDPGSRAATALLAQGRPTPKSQLARIVSSPSVWFALLGWGLAVLLLFRRQSS